MKFLTDKRLDCFRMPPRSCIIVQVWTIFPFLHGILSSVFDIIIKVVCSHYLEFFDNFLHKFKHAFIYMWVYSSFEKYRYARINSDGITGILYMEKMYRAQTALNYSIICYHLSWKPQGIKIFCHFKFTSANFMVLRIMFKFDVALNSISFEKCCYWFSNFLYGI